MASEQPNNRTITNETLVFELFCGMKNSKNFKTICVKHFKEKWIIFSEIFLVLFCDFSNQTVDRSA